MSSFSCGEIDHLASTSTPSDALAPSDAPTKTASAVPLATKAPVRLEVFDDAMEGEVKAKAGSTVHKLDEMAAKRLAGE